MQPSQNAYNLVKAFEGCRLEAYPDPGTGGEPWTIGYGSTVGVTAGMVITQEQADARLERDMAAAAAAVEKYRAAPLNQNQFDALCDFVFNVGAEAFRTSTLLRLLNSRSYKSAAYEFGRWTRAGGRVLPGLVKRRAAERQLFETAA